MTDEQRALEVASIISGRSQRCPECQLYHQTARTNIAGVYPELTEYDLNIVRDHLTEEEKTEMIRKMGNIFNVRLDIKEIQIQAVMEKAFIWGYLAAHVTPQKKI